MIVFDIALNGVRMTLKRREAVFWIFIGPLIMATFFGILFKAQPPEKVRVDVVNADATDTVATSITDTLEKDGIVVTRAAAVTPGRTTLVIPAGAASALAAAQPLDLQLHTGAEETRADADLRFKVFTAVVEFAIGVKPTDPAGPLAIVPADVGAKATPVTAGFQRSVPSYMVMFVFLNLLVSGAGIAEERKLGLLRRLGMAPIARRDIVLGKVLGRFFIGWIQMAWLLLAGRVLFSVQWAEHGWILFGFLSLFALACASLGVFFGTLFTDPDKCRGIALWTAILLAPLGGLWWPIEIVGPTLKRISHLVPTGWAMEPVNAMLAFGAGARDVLPFAAAFAALFVVTFVLATRRLQTV
jgi:ABC-type polysaccharide/polyol phosphate export permease